ncbi:hypothetical protein [Aquipseudomonas alcaligenes]|uniref:hypothetical protein n=1 Tax=Aquipseudomonas alcaligenes TaxID=43263 RepID=UPI001659AAF2|nr:hypothetical protein [Pseudomonas alcaligenes]
MKEAEKGAHFRPARRCGAMKDRRKPPGSACTGHCGRLTGQYQKVLILLLLTEK